MAYLPLRSVQVPASAEGTYERWLADVEAKLADPGADWYRLTRDILFDLWYPGLGDYDPHTGGLLLCEDAALGTSLSGKDAEGTMKCVPICVWPWSSVSREAKGREPLADAAVDRRPAELISSTH